MSIHLSLDGLRALVVHLPAYTRPTIHIAGTNGKGSVSALVSSILLSASPPLRVGRYNSPHLTTVRDCITIDNVAVSQDAYDDARTLVVSAAQEHGIELSPFEVLTMTALQVFEAARVDIVVLEVGMGGRLDATNVVDSECILVSALTAVDLDHQAFLGDTVQKIAREKAAIARAGRPFVLGKQKHAAGDVEELAREVVASAGGEVRDAVDVVRDEREQSYEFSLSSGVPGAQRVVFSLTCFAESSPISASLPLRGAHQLDNLGTALGIIDALLTRPTPSSASLHLEQRITPASLVAGIESASWPGRLSFHTIRDSNSQKDLLVLADGAHNASSAHTLASYLRDLATHNPGIPLTFVLGLSHSPPKTPREVVGPLLTTMRDVTLSQLNIALLPFSPPEGMPWVKHVPVSDLLHVVRELAPDLAEDCIFAVHEDRGDAMNSMLTWAAQRHQRLAPHEDRQDLGGRLPGLVVIAGSLYLVADFYRWMETVCNAL